MEGIIIAIITGVFSFSASLVANMNSNKKLVSEFKCEVTRNQAITDIRLEDLTREVREHNDFAKRLPVVEEEIKNLKEKVNYFHNV